MTMRQQSWAAARCWWRIAVIGLCCLASAAPLGAQSLADEEATPEAIYVSIFAVTGNGFARQIVAVDPQTGKCETIAAEGHGPRISPDGKTLAYWSFVGPNEGRDVWVKQLGGMADAVRVWSGPGSVTVSWAPDGEHLIVSEGERGASGWTYKTWLVDPVKSEAALMDVLPPEHVVDYSPAAGLLLLSNARTQLDTLRFDGTGRSAVSGRPARVFAARISPDGRQVAYVRHRDRTEEVCTSDIDGKKLLVALVAEDLTEPAEVGWSRDGKQLAVVLFDYLRSDQPRKIRHADADHNYRLMIMAPDGTARRELKLDRAVTEIGAPEWR